MLMTSGPVANTCKGDVDMHTVSDSHSKRNRNCSGKDKARELRRQIDDSLDDLHQQARTQRQNEITEELLDVVSGAEALGQE